MRNFWKGIVFITILAAIGLILSCDEPEPVTLTGTVVITGNAQAGQVLFADTSALGGSGTISYQWRRGGSSIAGANSDTYVVQSADVGSFITVTVRRSDIPGSVTSAQTAVVIDNNTGTIGLSYTLINNGTAYSVFRGTANAANVVIPSVHEGLPVVEISDSGFSSYTNLQSITIPVGVTRIGNYAFSHCSNLTSIVLPAGITNIGNFAFQDCGGLTSVFYGGSNNTEWTTITIGSNNSQLTNANLYYYLETNSETVGFFWRFVNGVPIGTTYYSVTFNSNGGTAVAAQIINHGDRITRPTNLSRSGYVFDYWYSNAELTMSYDFTTPVISNVTLYARWIEWNAIINNIEMVQIPAGTLTWGSATITLSTFKMGVYEVTQELYEAVMGVNPSGFNSNPAAGETQGKRPVEMVTWFDAVEFCNKLSEIEGLTPVYTITGRTPATGYPITSATVTANWNANGYRLPTEAQWEYACRAGSTTNWYFGDTESELVNYAWYWNNSNSRTHQVGLKQPNAFGLYDMHGNVGEWCWDWFGGLPTSNQTDYAGAVSGSYRVERGGCWYNSAEYARSSFRSMSYPYNRYSVIGFRVVRP